MQLSDVRGLDPLARARLEEIGVTTVPQLVAAEPERIAPEAGLTPGQVREMQSLARAAWEEGAPQVPAPHPSAYTPLDPLEVLRREVDELRVVLRDRAATARVKVGSVWHEDVPIVIAKVQESEARIRENLKENAVLLREKATTASVHIEGRWLEDAPLYKERLQQATESGMEKLEEIRVRVDEIRETRRKRQAEQGKKGFFSRLFG